MRKIDKIIVHCTATIAGREYTVDDIRSWHVQGNGWSDIGYHWVIGLNGEIWAGRPEHKVGAHCSGYNANSIGVCYVGGLSKNNGASDTRTQKQKQSLRLLLSDLKERYPNAKIHGHRDFSKKACPCFDAKKEYENL